MRPALVLDSQTSPEGSSDRWRQLDRVEVADIYALPDLALDRYGALVLAGMVDQEFLWHCSDLVASFLDCGRTVVFCGQLFRPWLPGCGMFVPTTIRGFGDYVVHLAQPHPVFCGVDPAHLTFRRGVAGFFARGHHPPPKGASVLATLAGGQPMTWVDNLTTRGTVFVHSGADLLGYASTEDTACRMVPQLLDWACEQGSRS